MRAARSSHRPLTARRYFPRRVLGWHDPHASGDLGGANSYASGINDQGQVTGQSETAVSGSPMASSIDQGVMYDVNDLLPASSVEVQGAYQITNSGYILGYSQSGPVLLVPGPRPAAAYDVINVGVGLGVDTQSPQRLGCQRQQPGRRQHRLPGVHGTMARPPSNCSRASSPVAPRAINENAGQVDRHGTGERSERGLSVRRDRPLPRDPWRPRELHPGHQRGR